VKVFLNSAAVEQEQSCSLCQQLLPAPFQRNFFSLCLPISHPQSYPTKIKHRLVKTPLLPFYRGKKQKDGQKGKSASLAPYLWVQRPRGKKSVLPTEMKESPSSYAPQYQGSTTMMSTSYPHLISASSPASMRMRTSPETQTLPPRYAYSQELTDSAVVHAEART